MNNADLFINETDYPDLNISSAAAHLQNALRFQTVSHLDAARTDYSQFDALHAFLRESYPHLSAHAVWEEIGHNLLITLKGTDDDLRPALLMAHQDVVPIIPGTEGDWIHRPYSGDMADGYIWGRGAMDIKQMLIAIMESAEYWLSKGAKFARTLYLAFGDDEETSSLGARAIVDVLASRGITLEFVLDEGAGDVTDAADYGAPGTLVCPIGMYEKGYGDLRIRAASRGGHSSNPFHGTSLGDLAESITDILRNAPEPRLSEAVRQALKLLAPRITEKPMADWVKEPEQHEPEILGWFCQRESLYHQVRTTLAPTMVTGGSPAANVMPRDMEAVINIRMIPEDTPDSLLEAFRRAVNGRVSIDWIQQISASVPSLMDAYGYNCLKRTLEHYFDRLVFIPAQNKGATDARWYECICRCVMRFGPFLEEEDISREGVHGVNERISVRAFAQGIRVLTHLIELTCISNGASK